MRYRKLPIEVEAFKYDGDLIDKKGNYYVPKWAQTAHELGILYYAFLNGKQPQELFVKTLEGNMHVSVGSYVVKGVKGELYAVKGDIFEETYAEVEENE